MGCRCCGGTFLAARALRDRFKVRLSAAQRFPVASLPEAAWQPLGPGHLSSGGAIGPRLDRALPELSHCGS